MILPGESAPASPNPIPTCLATLDHGVAMLPAALPRPESLISPRSEDELEAWTELEAARRAELDRAVLSWLSDAHWPSGLDGEGGFLILQRMRAARYWLQAARGLLEASIQPMELLQHLLVGCWADEFLYQHLEALNYRMQMYQSGRDDARDDD